MRCMVLPPQRQSTRCVASHRSTCLFVVRRITAGALASVSHSLIRERIRGNCLKCQTMMESLESMCLNDSRLPLQIGLRSIARATVRRINLNKESQRGKSRATISSARASGMSSHRAYAVSKTQHSPAQIASILRRCSSSGT